jgi:hypothetical protein
MPRATKVPSTIEGSTGGGSGLAPVPSLPLSFPEMPETAGNATPFAFELIDLDAHADGKLMRLCGEMTRLQERWGQPDWMDIVDRYWRTAEAILSIHPKTVDGLQMKALVALDMLEPNQKKLDRMGVKGASMWGGCVSIVKDVIRGVPA